MHIYYVNIVMLTLEPIMLPLLPACNRSPRYSGIPFSAPQNIVAISFCRISCIYPKSPQAYLRLFMAVKIPANIPEPIAIRAVGQIFPKPTPKNIRLQRNKKTLNSIPVARAQRIFFCGARMEQNRLRRNEDTPTAISAQRYIEVSGRISLSISLDVPKAIRKVSTGAIIISHRTVFLSL